MQELKRFLKSRLKFLYELADTDLAGNGVNTLSQIHEIKIIQQWIDEHENADEFQPHAHTTTPTDAGKTYADGVKDAYNDVLHMIYADGYNADAIAKALENVTEKTPCNN